MVRYDRNDCHGLVPRPCRQGAQGLATSPPLTTQDGRSRPLRCAIQNWVRRSEPRPRHALATRHPGFELCNRAKADVSLQRVGSAAGRPKEPSEAASAQSHLFLRAVRCSPAEL